MDVLLFRLQKCKVVTARSSNKRSWQAIDAQTPRIYQGKSCCRKTPDANIPPTAPNDTTRAEITAFLLWDSTLSDDLIRKFVHDQALTRWMSKTHVGQDAGYTHGGARSTKKKAWRGVTKVILTTLVKQNTYPCTSNRVAQ